MRVLEEWKEMTLKVSDGYREVINSYCEGQISLGLTHQMVSMGMGLEWGKPVCVHNINIPRYLDENVMECRIHYWTGLCHDEQPALDVSEKLGKIFPAPRLR